MKQIKLSELVLNIIEWKRLVRENFDEAQKVYDKIGDMVNAITIRESLSLLEKTEAMTDILAGISSPDLNAIDAQASLVVGKFVYGLLRYTTNLENDMNFATIDPTLQISFYDLLVTTMHVDDYLLGTGDYKGKPGCLEDYNKLVSMVDGAVNFSNVFQITRTAELMSPERLAELHDVIKELKTELTPERIKQLVPLAVEGSPEWQAFKDSFQQDVVDNVLNHDANALGNAGLESAKESRLASKALDSLTKAKKAE